MAVCVSLINMKGGVGKTTLATQLAWYAVMRRDLRVLLIDLDPQANASQSVMQPREWAKYLDRGGRTVQDIFEQFTPATRAGASPKALDPADVIHPRIEYDDGSLLHLIPARLELSSILRNPYGMEPLLARFVSRVETRYDLILVDCSPTDSVLTDAAYHCSRYVLVPIRAEFLAAVGFPLLDHSLEAFRARYQDRTIEVAGLVFNAHNRGNKTREHKIARRDVRAKAKELGWPVLVHDVPFSASYFRATREGLAIEATKGTRRVVKAEFRAFADEFFSRIGLS